MFAGPTPSTLLGHDLAVDEDLTAPNSPRFFPAKSTLEAFGAERAVAAQGASAGEVARPLGEPQFYGGGVLARQDKMTLI